jgi:hypothetical protein
MKEVLTKALLQGEFDMVQDIAICITETTDAKGAV